MSCSAHTRDNKKYNTIHGMSETKIYRAWRSMRGRCFDKTRKGYENYGGRGIKVCDRWLDFSNFYTDMGTRPKGKTLDRIDNNGDYCPENCKWSTWKEQHANKRNMRFVEFRGVKLTVSQWSERVGLTKSCLRNRLNRGWTIERALMTPINIKGF